MLRRTFSSLSMAAAASFGRVDVHSTLADSSSSTAVNQQPQQRRILWCADERQAEAVNAAYFEFRQRLFRAKPQLMAMPDRGESFAYMQWLDQRERLRGNGDADLESRPFVWSPPRAHLIGTENHNAQGAQKKAAAAKDMIA